MMTSLKLAKGGAQMTNFAWRSIELRTAFPGV
jgi:hypothetical protein